MRRISVFASVCSSSAKLGIRIIRATKISVTPRITNNAAISVVTFQRTFMGQVNGKCPPTDIPNGSKPDAVHAPNSVRTVSCCDAASRWTNVQPTSGLIVPERLHALEHGRIGDSAAASHLVLFEMFELRRAWDGAGDCGMRDHVPQKKLAPASDIDIGCP